MASFDTPDSPRGKAHAALIQALTSHDPGLLQRALQEGRATECATSEGFRAAQKALDTLSRGQRPTEAAARKKYAAQQLQAAIERGTESALQAAMFEAVEAGVEDGLPLAERALTLARADRNRTLDLLVESMDMTVQSAEEAPKYGRIGADPVYVERLKAMYQEAAAVAGEEDEVVLCAAQMLDFETARLADLKDLDAKLKGHISNMENIVDAVEREFPYLDAAGDGLSVGPDLGLAATTRASEAYASKTFKAPTYSQQQQQHQQRQQEQHHTASGSGPATAATATTSLAAPRRASQIATTSAPAGSATALSANLNESANFGAAQISRPTPSGGSGHGSAANAGRAGSSQHAHTEGGGGAYAGREAAGSRSGNGYPEVTSTAPDSPPPTASTPTPRRVSLSVPGVVARTSGETPRATTTRTAGTSGATAMTASQSGGGASSGGGGATSSARQGQGGGGSERTSPRSDSEP
eukprot:CAMPEP_0206580474 /NCGR_PEP_ID=MMETSP0325_2-20121206/33186_1 /ASSEMBLY_ACC=CAM_ASM_000347 /TAXON_ID=2866 /ORGANISM="Crypthecodinium cohnii, Strain Seligo" /LENGTH=469 /DNA_ID=CAMNT_0054086523 /DNA_START=53 /DNA_END=1458 /DNA_ORIENTATION=+